MQLHAQPSTQRRLAIRGGVGIQESFYGELGLSRTSCTYNCAGYGATGTYAALEFVPARKGTVYGVKAGAELNIMFLALATEVKYQTDFTGWDIVVTPRVGLGGWGKVLLFYGYNASVNGRLHDTGPHQLALVFNPGVLKTNKQKQTD